LETACQGKSGVKYVVYDMGEVGKVLFYDHVSQKNIVLAFSYLKI
jgi:hypothetical protein